MCFFIDSVAEFSKKYVKNRIYTMLEVPPTHQLGLAADSIWYNLPSACCTCMHVTCLQCACSLPA